MPSKQQETTVTLNVRKLNRDAARRIKAEAARRGLTIALYLELLTKGLPK